MEIDLKSEIKAEVAACVQKELGQLLNTQIFQRIKKNDIRFEEIEKKQQVQLFETLVHNNMIKYSGLDINLPFIRNFYY